MKIDFKEHQVHNGLVKIAEATIIQNGKSIQLDFRLDFRGPKIRLDCMKPIQLGWEAIDGGDGFDSEKEALSHLQKWIAAAEIQNDLTPRM